MGRRPLTSAEIEELQGIIQEYGLEEIEKRYLLSPEELRNRLKNFKDYGLSKEEMGEMVKKLSLILKYSSKRTNKALNNLKDYGFADKEIKEILKKFPLIIGYTPKRTNKVLNNLKNYGFTERDIKKMVEKSPSIISYTAERTGKIIRWLFQHQIKADLIKRPGILIFSLETLEERRQVLEKIGYNYQQYPSLLFYPKKKWQRFLERN